MKIYSGYKHLPIFSRKSQKKKAKDILSKALYLKYPNFRRALDEVNANYNRLIEEMTEDECEGRIFMQAPSDTVSISKFEGDMEKLGELYFRGYNEMKINIPSLKIYLDK